MKATMHGTKSVYTALGPYAVTLPARPNDAAWLRQMRIKPSAHGE